MTCILSLLGWLVGRDHDAVGRSLGVEELKSGIYTAVSKETAARPQNQRVDQEHILVDEVMLHERLHELAAAHNQEVLPGCALSSASTSGTSPLSRVELLHGSGSFSVLEATYFGVLLSTFV